MRNAFNGSSKHCIWPGIKISELEETSVEISQDEISTDKKNKNQKRISKNQDHFKGCNIYILEILEWIERREQKKYLINNGWRVSRINDRY